MISIIIPVYNEAKNILKLLSYLEKAIDLSYVKEVIVVDGESIDTTVKIIEKYKETSSLPIQLLNSNKGRAVQMNSGASQASGDVLYFLHADSFPSKDFEKHIISSVKNGHLAGCFKMKFDNNHWWLQLAGWFTQFNWKSCRGGDQSLFITKKLFEDLGGYDERYTIFEDNILINALYKKKQFVVLQQPITTSARLYEKVGIWKTQFHFWMIYTKKKLGASPQELYAYYVKHLK